jgi:DNA-binding transcriptional MerR regulator
MSARLGDSSTDGSELYTVDELASKTGLTVRTIRYYVGLGLVPPPVRDGRVAYYDARHRGRLELLRTLRDYGLTLDAVERYLASIPSSASVQDLALQRVMMTSWQADLPERLTGQELAARLGRRVEHQVIERLVATMSIRRGVDGLFEILPNFSVGADALGLDVPFDAFVAATDAIERHMDELVNDLGGILKEQVLAPFTKEPRSEAEENELEENLQRVRLLTLEAVICGFQNAANQVIARSLIG